MLENKYDNNVKKVMTVRKGERCKGKRKEKMRTRVLVGGSVSSYFKQEMNVELLCREIWFLTRSLNGIAGRFEPRRPIQNGGRRCCNSRQTRQR